MNKRWFLFVVSAVVLSGCSSVSVRRDYDKSTDFSALKTFAWKYAEQPQTGNPRIDNDLIDERIRSAVDATLAAKGFRSVEKSDADFLVSYFMDYQQRLGGGSVSVGMSRGSGGGRYGGVGYNSGVSDYEQGRLTIDLLDPQDDKTVWRAVGTRTTYDGSNPEKTTKIVNSAVASILKKFPPK